MSQESEESLLLERAFLRIGSAQSDDQFEMLIDKLLGPIIFKVPSPYDSVRKKAIELLTHISKRLKCRPEVQVPVKLLLQLYVQATNDQFVKNFLIVYIKLGYPRMVPEKQLECLPLLINCIKDAKTTDQLKNSFLGLLIKSCKHFSNQELTKEFLRTHNLKDWNNLDLMLEVFYDVLLIPYSWEEYLCGNSVPPGMSRYSFKRITQDGKIEDLHQVKLGIAYLLDNCNLSGETTFIHFVAASVDTNMDVSALGKQRVKNCYGTFEWTDETLRPLYRLFVGDNEKIEETHRRVPADLRMKINLLPYLHKLNTYCWPECIQVVVACLQENANVKVKISGLNFGLSALRKAELHSFKEVAPNFLNVLTEILWKREMDTNVRTLIYRLAGNVIALNPELVEDYKEIFPKFIEDLTEEKVAEVRNTIKESLIKMAYSFKHTEKPDALMNFLVNRITSPEPCVKHIVLHYLHKVFPADHIRSRFLLAWSSADKDPTIRTEAEQLLLSDLKSNQDEGCSSDRSCVPNFQYFLKFLSDGCINSMNQLNDKFRFLDQNLPLTSATLTKLLLYLRTCMLFECCPSLSTMKFDHPCRYTPNVRAYLKSLHQRNPLVAEQYLDLMCHVTCQTENVETFKCLLEYVGCVPEEFALQLYQRSFVLLRMLNHSNDEMNYLASTLDGIVICYGPGDIIGSKLRGYGDILESPSGDYIIVLTALWSIASFAERGGFRRIAGVPAYIVEAIVGLFTHSASAVVIAACHCLGQIGRRNDLPFPNRNLKDPVKYGDFDGLQQQSETSNENRMMDVDKSVTTGVESDEQTSSLTQLKIVEKLLDLAVDKNSVHKVKIKAAEALGLLCVGVEDFPYRKLIINTLIDKENEVKDMGQLMDLGNVLSDCVMGSGSIHAMDFWTQNETEYELPKSWDSTKAKELFMFAYCKISNDLVLAEKRKSKTAAAVWLLILMKKCIKLTLDVNELSRIQYTFLELMIQNDDVIHDVATRGLSFIPRFTNADAASVLAKQLTDNISLIQKKTSEIGTVLSMYKEFSYLVSSLKNHALIYHFLNLINHRTDSDKYASAFQDHEEVSIKKLTPYYQQMMPSLYVYRYHPSGKIKQAMNTIWTTLFPENVKTVQTHSKTILEKIIPDLTCPISELRIAYCLALEDLLRIGGMKFMRDNKELMPELLTNLYKLMDDIYDAVRRTAYGTTRMYLQAFENNVQRSKSQNELENELLDGVLPVLLNVGVRSNVKDVRSISVKTLLEVIDNLGERIKSHLPVLIPSMIENASEVELEVRYFEQRRGVELPDSANDALVSIHFSSEIIKRCTGYIDEDVLEKLFPRLLELLKETISMSTRSAAINFVVLLSRSMDGQKLQPFVGKMLAALFTGLSNNHKNIRKNSANAIGSLSKLAKDSSLDNLLTKLVQLFVKNIQDENIKSAVGQTLLAVASQNQEAVQERSEKIVPVIFFAMHLKKTADGANDQFIELWNEVWNDVIGSMEVALSKHKTPIIEFLSQSFSSPSWNIKTQAARALSTFVTKCPDDLRDHEELQKLIQDVVNVISGKFWHGKEDVVETTVTLCSSKRIVNDELHVQILEAVLRECSRANLSYQAIALESLGKILISSDYKSKYFKDIYEKLKSIILKEEDEFRNSDRMESDEDSTLINQRLKLKETAYFVLGKAWPDDVQTQSLFQEEVISMLTECLFKSTRLTQVSIMVALKNLLAKLAIIRKVQYTTEEETIVKNIMFNVEKLLKYAIEMKKHTLLKKEALHVMINLLEVFHDYRNASCSKLIEKLYSDHVNELMKDSDPIIVLQTSQLRDLLKRGT